MPAFRNLTSLNPLNLKKNKKGEVLTPSLPSPGALARQVVGKLEGAVDFLRRLKALKNVVKCEVFASWGYLGVSWGSLGPS